MSPLRDIPLKKFWLYLGIAQIAVRPPHSNGHSGAFLKGGYNSKKRGTNHTGKDLDPPPKRTIGLGEKSKVEKKKTCTVGIGLEI